MSRANQQAGNLRWLQRHSVQAARSCGTAAPVKLRPPAPAGSRSSPAFYLTLRVLAERQEQSPPLAPAVCPCEPLCAILGEGIGKVPPGSVSGEREALVRKCERPVLEGNQRVFARSILAQDKERWSHATTSQPQSPAVRGFFTAWTRYTFSAGFPVSGTP